nr:MAG TPA: hypothetical protein [Caudoviricetes sp.]
MALLILYTIVMHSILVKVYIITFTVLQYKKESLYDTA